MSDNRINNNISNDEKDWRYRGQDEYLSNIELVHCEFSSSIREHDHCEFCWEKFSENEGDLHIGYCTKDKYYWICEDCFNDFKHMFHWIIQK